MFRWGPLRRRHAITGVPADHFAPRASRHVAYDHRGRITALVADGDDDTGGATPDGTEAPPEARTPTAVPLHHTATSRASWNGLDVERRLTGVVDPGAAYAWSNPDGEAGSRASKSFLHHEVDSDGTIGPANSRACALTVETLNGKRGVDPVAAAWAADRVAIYEHVLGHLIDAGVPTDELPALDDAEFDLAAFVLDHFAEHGSFDGSHSHEHSAMGSQGDDARHSHTHTHSDDAVHTHTHAAAVDEAEALGATVLPAMDPNDPASVEAAAQAIVDWYRRVSEYRATTPDVTRTKVRLHGDDSEAVTASAWIELAVRWDENAPGERPGTTGNFVSTTAAPDGFVAAGADVPSIVDNPGAPWHAYLCAEGIRTDEYWSREITLGACQFPDLPVSLRLQIEDEGGHWGAVSCGRIDNMSRLELDGYNLIPGDGVFGTDENGQLAQLLVTEQTQRFVSIDPRDIDVEEIIVPIPTPIVGGDIYFPDELDIQYEIWDRYTSLVVGAATIVATPALQQAVITLASVPLPEAPLALERAPTTPVVVASGGPVEPPAAWFADPAFHVGDSRLVRQADGHYACPLTVTDDGRVFGHAAYWGAEHTAFPTGDIRGRDVTPPRSPSYGYFMTGEVTTAEGEKFAVGQITMGCGHAGTGLGPADTISHYDGGFGAVQMADVRAGEDDFGIWIAGAIKPLRSDDNPQGPTPEQVAQFRSLGVSGDWRKIAGAKHLHALLAVPVPGFPIARESLVASAADIVDLYAVRAGIDADGEVVSLVAAGRVRPATPEDRLGRLEAFFEGMRPMVAEWTARRREAAAEVAAAALRDLG